MFASIALGLALDLMFPGIPVAATMAGALVAALKAPLFAALFTMVLVQKETAPVIARRGGQRLADRVDCAAGRTARSSSAASWSGGGS